MPYFKTSQEWLDQSTLLVEARPATTRVTTRYSIKPAKPRKAVPESDAAQSTTTATATATATATTSTTTSDKPPRAFLVLKTYDPVSGVTLKYKTTKAAEVGRLVSAALGRLGKAMAGVPVVPEESMPDASASASASAAVGGGGGGGADGDAAAGTATPTESQQAGGGGGGGAKKKKKGRK